LIICFEDIEEVDQNLLIWNNPIGIVNRSDLESGSIDHGSLWFESPKNCLIFKDKTTLTNFLYGVNSLVCERSDEIDDTTTYNLGDLCTK
jgi:hypothetical protein